MTRFDYLRELERYLRGRLPRREIDEILRDYAEYFNEGAAQGKTETEIAMKMGFPRDLAEQILSESRVGAGRGWRRRFRDQGEYNYWFKILAVVLIVLLSPVWLSVLGVLLGTALAVIGTVLGLLIAGIVVFIAGVSSVSWLVPAGWALLMTVGVGLVSLGVCLFGLLWLTVRGLTQLAQKHRYSVFRERPSDTSGGEPWREQPRPPYGGADSRESFAPGQSEAPSDEAGAREPAFGGEEESGYGPDTAGERLREESGLPEQEEEGGNPDA